MNLRRSERVLAVATGLRVFERRRIHRHRMRTVLLFLKLICILRNDPEEVYIGQPLVKRWRECIGCRNVQDCQRRLTTSEMVVPIFEALA